jgi:hypothetical protein
VIQVDLLDAGFGFYTDLHMFDYVQSTSVLPTLSSQTSQNILPLRKKNSVPFVKMTFLILVLSKLDQFLNQFRVQIIHKGKIKGNKAVSKFGSFSALSG